MINEYRELFKYKKAMNFISDSQFADYYPRETDIIKEALQAGAEGRILPKLPEGWSFLDGTEHEYFDCVSFICKQSNGKTVAGYGRTPTKSLQNAIDTIGGE